MMEDTKKKQEKGTATSEVLLPKGTKMLNNHIPEDAITTLCWTHLLPLWSSQHHQDTLWLLPTQGKGKFATQLPPAFLLTGASNGAIKPHAKSNKCYVTNCVFGNSSGT